MSFWNALTGKKKTPQQWLAAGNNKEALKGFLELEKTKQNDPVLLNSIADLYLRLGQPQQAREYYIRVGDYYGEKGFFNKSVAVFKKALNITPGDPSIIEKLVAFNDKVPKFMLDDQFFKQAMGDKAPPQATKPPAAAEPEPAPEPDSPPADGEGLALAADASGDLAFEHGFTHGDQAPETVVEPVPEPAPVPAAPQAAPDREAPAFKDDLPGIGDIDFDTINEISEDLTAEFEKAAVDAHGPTVLQKNEPPAKQARAVFKSRVDQTPAPSGGDQAFSSFDDALDAVFAKDPGTPAQQDDREQHQKHWPLFRTMSSEVFVPFITALETRDYEPGDYIIRMGETGDEMFLISQGQVNIEMEKGGKPVAVATLGEGAFFGEAALLTRAPRNASVVAAEPTTCLVLDRDHLIDLAKSHPPVLASIKSIYNKRLTQNASQSRRGEG